MTSGSESYYSRMAALAHRFDSALRPREDHYVHLREASWRDYERLLEIRGEASVPRITYLEGALEMMSPSFTHEGIAATIGRLVEVWCLARGIEFTAAGSWTIKSARDEAGAEPDECYVFGLREGLEPPARPDLAIEVVWTHGGLSKLAVYRKLGVPEVWYWQAGRINLHLLRSGRYEPAEGSEALPDLEQLASHLDRPTTSQAIRAYRAALGSL